MEFIMKRNLMFLGLLVTLETFSLNAEIISGMDTVPCGWDLSFSPHALTRNNYRGNTHDGGNVYTCSTSTAMIDLFIATYGLYVCSYTCWNIAIGSPRPFYASRNSQDILKSLNLNDTNLFTKCDTIWRDMCIQSMPKGDSTHCYLPHLDSKSANASPLTSGSFLLLKTSTGKYVIAQLSPIISEGRDITYIYHYLSGFLVTWYLQTDGTQSFSEITGIRTQAHQEQTTTRFMWKTNGFSPEIYNVRGQRIAAKTLRQQNANGVLLFVNNRDVNRVVWRSIAN
jgi:hypothetical protein